MRQFAVRDQKERFDVRFEAAVRHHERQLGRKVGDRSDAANDDASAQTFGKTHRKSFVCLRFNIRKTGGRASDQLAAFLGGEPGRFLRIDADGDDQAVEEAAGALDDVKVAEGDRVERTGINGESRVGHRTLLRRKRKTRRKWDGVLAIDGKTDIITETRRRVGASSENVAPYYIETADGAKEAPAFGVGVPTAR